MTIVNKDEMVQEGSPSEVEAFQELICIDCRMQNGVCIKETDENDCPVDDGVAAYEKAS